MLGVLRLASVHDAAQAFAMMVREQRVAGLTAWVEAMRHSEERELRGFAEGLLADYAAVRAGLTPAESNGATEGQINRLTSVKRAVSGRGKMDLFQPGRLQLLWFRHKNCPTIRGYTSASIPSNCLSDGIELRRCRLRSRLSSCTVCASPSCSHDRCCTTGIGKAAHGRKERAICHDHDAAWRCRAGTKGQGEEWCTLPRELASERRRTGGAWGGMATALCRERF